MVISLPHDSRDYIGKVITERKRDATPHNKYLGPRRLTFIRFWDSAVLGELHECSHYLIQRERLPFVIHNQLQLEMNTYNSDDIYDWMNLDWANGSPYSRVYNSDEHMEFLPTYHKEAVLQLNWCFQNFWQLLERFEYYPINPDGSTTTRRAMYITKNWVNKEHARTTAHCDEFIGKADNDVMNREHNSLATAIEYIRDILMTVPNCNDRGNLGISRIIPHKLPRRVPSHFHFVSPFIQSPEASLIQMI